MKRKLIYLQFTENGLIILHNKKIKEFILKSVNNHIIDNKDLFVEEINSILEKNNINNKIVTDNLNILIDSTYSNFYIFSLEMLFKEISFNNIKFTNITDIIELKEEELLVEISTNSIKILSKTISINNNIYYLKHKSILNIYLKKILKLQSIKTIYIYGNYQFTKKMLEDIERATGIKVYIYTQPNLIPIKLLA